MFKHSSFSYLAETARFAHFATACGTHSTFATVHRKVAIRHTPKRSFRISPPQKNKQKPYLTARFPFIWRRRRDSPTSLPLVARTRPLRPFTERSQFGIHRNGLFESHHHKRINGNHTLRHDFRLFGGDGEIRTRGGLLPN